MGAPLWTSKATVQGWPECLKHKPRPGCCSSLLCPYTFLFPAAGSQRELCKLLSVQLGPEALQIPAICSLPRHTGSLAPCPSLHRDPWVASDTCLCDDVTDVSPCWAQGSLQPETCHLGLTAWHEHPRLTFTAYRLQCRHGAVS